MDPGPNIFPQLDCGKRLYLIMSGSMGFGNSEKLISELLKRYEDHITVLTVCGTNEKLRDRLTGAFGANEKCADHRIYETGGHLHEGL